MLPSVNRPRLFHGWVIVAVSFVSMGLSGGAWYSFSVFLVALDLEFGWSRAETAFAFSVFVLLQGATAPIVGWMMGRFGVRRLMSAGAILLGSALVSCSFVSSPWHFYLSFGVFASIGASAVGMVPTYALLSRWFIRRSGLAVGIVSAGVGALGLLMLVPLCQYLVLTIGWRGAYLVLAAVVVVFITPLTLFLLRDWPQDKGSLPDGVEPVLAEAGRKAIRVQPRETNYHESRPDWTARRAMRTWRFWSLYAAFVCTSFAIQTVFVHQVAYFLDLGYGAFSAAFAVALVGLVSIPMKVGWGWLSDWMGRAEVYTLGVVCTLAGVAVLLVLPGRSSEWLLYVFAVLFGSGYAMHASLNPTVSSDVFAGRHFALVYGFLGSATYFGSAIGPWLAAYLFDTTGNYAPAFLAAAAAISVTCLIIWVAAPRQGRVAAVDPK